VKVLAPTTFMTGSGTGRAAVVRPSKQPSPAHRPELESRTRRATNPGARSRVVTDVGKPRLCVPRLAHGADGASQVIGPAPTVGSKISFSRRGEQQVAACKAARCRRIFPSDLAKHRAAPSRPSGAASGDHFHSRAAGTDDAKLLGTPTGRAVGSDNIRPLNGAEDCRLIALLARQAAIVRAPC
jgi:hypothetical protein